MTQLVRMLGVRTSDLALRSFSAPSVERGNKTINGPISTINGPISASWHLVPKAAPEAVRQRKTVLHREIWAPTRRTSRTYCGRRSHTSAHRGGLKASAVGDPTPWSTTDSRVLSPEEHWEQSKPLFRIWHGFRTVWLPMEGDEVVQSCHGVRGMVLSKDGAEVVHTNDWWDWQDFGGVELPRYSNKSWTLSRSTDSLPDGILHPASPVARLLSLPNTDGAWVGKSTRVGDKFLAACEAFLVTGPDARLAIGLYWMGDRLNVTLYREKCLATAERDSKAPTDVWGALDSPPVRRAPVVTPMAGVLSGSEFSMSSGLELRERSGTWGGYGQLWPMPGSYSTLHLPANVSVTVPTAVNSGSGAFSFSVDWVPSDSQVSSLAVAWGADGELVGLRGGRYK